jgi:hypothetical protein
MNQKVNNKKLVHQELGLERQSDDAREFYHPH